MIFPSSLRHPPHIERDVERQLKHERPGLHGFVSTLRPDLDQSSYRKRHANEILKGKVLVDGVAKA